MKWRREYGKRGKGYRCVSIEVVFFLPCPIFLFFFTSQDGSPYFIPYYAMLCPPNVMSQMVLTRTTCLTHPPSFLLCPLFPLFFFLFLLNNGDAQIAIVIVISFLLLLICALAWLLCLPDWIGENGWIWMFVVVGCILCFAFCAFAF